MRQPAGSLGDIATAWAAQDAGGRSLGALSGRAETREVVAGATIVVDYGTPAKRGRTSPLANSTMFGLPSA